MNIDPNTGLPQLPDAHFWEVREHSIKIIQDHGMTSWADRDYGPYRDRGETRRISTRSWWGKKTEKTEYRYRRNQTQFTRFYGKREGDGYRISEPDPVTRENILERATEVYNEWQEKAEREKLYGEYPPNKLED